MKQPIKKKSHMAQLQFLKPLFVLPKLIVQLTLCITSVEYSA